MNIHYFITTRWHNGAELSLCKCIKRLQNEDAHFYRAFSEYM